MNVVVKLLGSSVDVSIQESVDVFKISLLRDCVVMAALWQFLPDLGSFTDFKQAGHM